MACRPDGARPLSEPLLPYCLMDPWEQTSMNVNRNSYIFIHENALGNVVCEMAANLSRPQCVNSYWGIWKVRHTGSQRQMGSTGGMDFYFTLNKNDHWHTFYQWGMWNGVQCWFWYLNLFAIMLSSLIWRAGMHAWTQSNYDLHWLVLMVRPYNKSPCNDITYHVQKYEWKP